MWHHKWSVAANQTGDGNVTTWLELNENALIELDGGYLFFLIKAHWTRFGQKHYLRSSLYLTDKTTTNRNLHKYWFYLTSNCDGKHSLYCRCCSSVCHVDLSVHSENSREVFFTARAGPNLFPIEEKNKKKGSSRNFFLVTRQNRQVIKHLVNHMACNESSSLGTHRAKIRALRTIKGFLRSAFI